MVTVKFSGIDTTNDDLINQLLNALMPIFSNYNGVNLNIIDATNLEIDFG